MKVIKTLRHKGIKLIILIAFVPFSWLFKHFWIYPTFGDDHDISGFEFKIKF